MPVTNFALFVKVYNDTKKFPRLNDVAEKFGISERTVRTWAEQIKRTAKNDNEAPALIDRSQLNRKSEASAKTEVSVHKHATNRAERLKNEVRSVVTRSRYPVINSDAIVVDSHVGLRYSLKDEVFVEYQSKPRTWLTDTLRVAPIKNPKSRRFIFTGAQNDAQVHLSFWLNLQAYAKYVNAEIVVGAWTYETQWWSENDPQARWYDPLLTKHLCFGQMAIGDKLLFCGEMNTLPTASQPISDLANYARGKWGIFPHAKRQLKSIPSTDPNQQAHQVMTTGSCTIPKVIPRKAGVKSIFHHAIGAVVVEFDADGDFFCRHLCADADGSFYDLNLFVKNEKVTSGRRVESIVFGDIHTAKMNSKNAIAVFGRDFKRGKVVRHKESMINVLNPRSAFLHDIFDNQTRNHHHANDNAYKYELAYRKRESVLGEIEQVANFLSFIHADSTQFFVVESNHDIALDRYVREGRYRQDGINIKLGLELETAYLRYREKLADAIERDLPTPKFSLLEHAVCKLFGTSPNVSWVYDGSSHKVMGVEHGHHGFRGPNGAKGNVAGFARLGVKMSIADKHSPEINEGVFVAGVMELQHGYNKGPSGWAVAHIVQYPNGKRTLITMQNGKWRAPLISQS